MNFILRTQKEKNQNFHNRIIGDSYIITYNTSNKTREDWKIEVKKYFPEMKEFERIKAIVVSFDAFVIYENMKAWIMTECGTTFERIS